MSIELLISKVNELSSSVTFWNKIVIIFVFLTAFIAILYFVSSYVANQKAGALNNAKDKLMKAKDQEQALQIAKLNAETAEANAKAESEHLERMKLEKEVAPRIMEQRQSAKDLLQFQGTNVIIESLAESEPWRLAGQIAWTLENAKWNVMSGMKRFIEISRFFDGVTVEAEQGIRSEKGQIKQNAADALINILRRNNIETRRNR